MKKLNRKDRIINALIISFVIGVGFVVWFLPPAIAYWRSSEVYKRYSKVEGVRATYIKDFRVNDTLTVGVTLLEATTDSGWVMLQEEFGLPIIPKECEAEFCGDSNKVTVKSFSKNIPLYVDGDTLNDDIITISRYKHKIAHFVVQSKEQLKLIVHKQFDDNTKNDYLKYSNHEKKD